MIKETLRSIFKFLENEENKKTPIVWKIVNNEPIEQDDLIVNGDINMDYSDIESLPEGLYVNGDLSLFGSEIKSLPKNLKVGGYLNLFNTKITSLPEGLEVGGRLFIFKTNFTNFSDGELREMIKPGFIKGSIIRA